MIGLFDSGLGGLTVTREVMKLLPDYALLYLGDTARTPYGNKSVEVITNYGLQAAKFLVEQGAKAIVVACNTVSAVGLSAINQAYPHIPVFNVILPTIEEIKNMNIGSRIGVIGTRALVNSGIYQKLLSEQGNFKVIAESAPLLVPLVEEGWLDDNETKRIIKFYLRPFKKFQIEALVLACTHYPLLKALISECAGKKIKIIDPAMATATSLAKWLYDNPIEAAKIKKGEKRFCVTDYTASMEKTAQTWLKLNIKLEQVTIN